MVIKGPGVGWRFEIDHSHSYRPLRQESYHRVSPSKQLEASQVSFFSVFQNKCTLFLPHWTYQISLIQITSIVASASASVWKLNFDKGFSKVWRIATLRPTISPYGRKEYAFVRITGQSDDHYTKTRSGFMRIKNTHLKLRALLLLVVRCLWVIQCSYQRRLRCPLQSQCCGWCSS